jgi:hypothetical protein
MPLGCTVCVCQAPVSGLCRHFARPSQLNAGIAAAARIALVAARIVFTYTNTIRELRAKRGRAAILVSCPLESLLFSQFLARHSLAPSSAHILSYCYIA